MSLLNRGHDTVQIYSRHRSTDEDGNVVLVDDSTPLTVLCTVRPLSQQTPEGVELFTTYQCFCTALPEAYTASSWNRVVWKGADYRVIGTPFTTTRSARTSQTRWQMTSISSGSSVGS